MSKQFLDMAKFKQFLAEAVNHYEQETEEASLLEKALEACQITLRDDENDDEIVHVFVADTCWLTFHTAEWEWMKPDGTWLWEQADTEHKDDEAWEAHMRDGI